MTFVINISLSLVLGGLHYLIYFYVILHKNIKAEPDYKTGNPRAPPDTRIMLLFIAVTMNS